MASTFTISKYNGAGATETPNMTYLHLIAQDVAANGATDFSSVSANQITIPSSGSVYSYETWIKGKWGGTYNEITNFKFWRSTGPTNGSGGLTFRGGTTGSYATPVDTASSVATDTSWEDEGNAISVTVSGSTPNTVSNYIVLQLAVASTASPGNVGESTLSFKWTES